MRSPPFRAKGWFIGSGPVEAACKTNVAQRAKQAGVRATVVEGASRIPVNSVISLAEARNDCSAPVRARIRSYPGEVPAALMP